MVEVDRPSAFNVSVKNCAAITHTLSFVFMLQCLIKHKDNLSFTMEWHECASHFQCTGITCKGLIMSGESWFDLMVWQINMLCFSRFISVVVKSYPCPIAMLTNFLRETKFTIMNVASWGWNYCLWDRHLLVAADTDNAISSCQFGWIESDFCTQARGVRKKGT